MDIAVDKKHTNIRFSLDDKLILLTFDDNYVLQAINLILTIVKYNQNVSFVCFCSSLSNDNVNLLNDLECGIQIMILNTDKNLKTS